jgi:hypothetical protein
MYVDVSTLLLQADGSEQGRIHRIVRSTGWDTTFVERPEGWEITDVKLEEMARGFFEYYGNDFRLEEEVVSISNGMPMKRWKDHTTFLAELDHGVEGRGAPQEVVEDGELSKEEQRRQDDEDEVLATFAAEESGELEEEVKQASRSSSPFEYGKFEEPGSWSTKMLVVQDPFDLIRNTANNVEPDIVAALQFVRPSLSVLVAIGSPSFVVRRSTANASGARPYRPRSVHLGNLRFNQERGRISFARGSTQDVEEDEEQGGQN